MLPTLTVPHHVSELLPSLHPPRGESAGATDQISILIKTSSITIKLSVIDKMQQRSQGAGTGREHRSQRVPSPVGLGKGCPEPFLPPGQAAHSLCAPRSIKYRAGVTTDHSPGPCYPPARTHKPRRGYPTRRDVPIQPMHPRRARRHGGGSATTPHPFPTPNPTVSKTIN